jgi:hypothetical protein
LERHPGEDESAVQKVSGTGKDGAAMMRELARIPGFVLVTAQLPLVLERKIWQDFDVPEAWELAQIDKSTGDLVFYGCDQNEKEAPAQENQEEGHGLDAK